MKISVTRSITPPKFEPVTLNIVMESQNELDFFGTLFNMNGVNKVAKLFGLEEPRLWAELKNNGAEIQKRHDAGARAFAECYRGR